MLARLMCLTGVAGPPLTLSAAQPSASSSSLIRQEMYMPPRCRDRRYRRRLRPPQGLVVNSHTCTTGAAGSLRSTRIFADDDWDAVVLSLDEVAYLQVANRAVPTGRPGSARMPAPARRHRRSHSDQGTRPRAHGGRKLARHRLRWRTPKRPRWERRPTRTLGGAKTCGRA